MYKYNICVMDIELQFNKIYEMFNLTFATVFDRYI